MADFYPESETKAVGAFNAAGSGFGASSAGFLSPLELEEKKTLTAADLLIYKGPRRNCEQLGDQGGSEEKSEGEYDFR